MLLKLLSSFLCILILWTNSLQSEIIDNNSDYLDSTNPNRTILNIPKHQRIYKQWWSYGVMAAALFLCFMYFKIRQKWQTEDEEEPLNVPYAKPPIGKLRFSMAEITDPWTGIRNAREYSPACFSNASVETPTNHLPMSEDCLYLNVFTSEKCLMSKNCTSLIYTHGGGINSGSAIQFNDTFILERYVQNDIVFLIPAYRMGVFGLLFFGDDNLVPHNLGIRDCKLALQFIHQEIFNFGGNPDDINLLGHSAGAHISLVFGFSRLIDPDRQLIKRITIISAPPIYAMSDLLIKNCYDLAGRVGCYTPNITSDEEIVECLRNKDAHELIMMQREMEADRLYLWNFLPGEPFMHLNQTIADFKANAVPREMIIGNTVDENKWDRRVKENPSIAGAFMDWENPYEVAHRFNYIHDSAPKGSMYESFTQGIFVSTATYSTAQVDAGGKVFMFQSNMQPSSHVSDMQYFVGTHREDYHTPDMDIVDTFFSKMIVNFTKYGSPSPVWEPLDPKRMNYYALEVNTEKNIWPKMEEGFHEADVNFWLINMTAFDREVTRQKQLHNDSILPRYPMYPGPVINPPKTNERTLYEMSTEWWFYALIVLVAAIFFYFIYALKKRCLKKSTDENTPLLK